jgi:hypothetical protein
MRTTNSHDGKHRFNVSINHRIGREWLICFAAYNVALYGELPPAGKRLFWDKVRVELRTAGEEPCQCWEQHAEPERVGPIRQQATEFIDRLFPELTPH